MTSSFLVLNGRMMRWVWLVLAITCQLTNVFDWQWLRLSLLLSFFVSLGTLVQSGPFWEDPLDRLASIVVLSLAGDVLMFIGLHLVGLLSEPAVISAVLSLANIVVFIKETFWANVENGPPSEAKRIYVSRSVMGLMFGVMFGVSGALAVYFTMVEKHDEKYVAIGMVSPLTNGQLYVESDKPSEAVVRIANGSGRALRFWLQPRLGSKPLQVQEVDLVGKGTIDLSLPIPTFADCATDLTVTLAGVPKDLQLDPLRVNVRSKTVCPLPAQSPRSTLIPKL